MMAESENLPIKIKGYVKQDLIGKGTFGSVYRALNANTSNTVALKIPSSLDQEKEFRYFKKEVLILKSLDHENIIKAYETLEFEDENAKENDPRHPALVLEYCIANLRMLMNSVPSLFNWGQKKMVAKQILTGLAYLKENGVLHRDIQPKNILLSPEGIVKICDFGFAKAGGIFEIQEADGKGFTLGYCPPEALVNRTLLTYAADMWGAGCVLAEFLMGMKRHLLLGNTSSRQLISIFRLCGFDPDTKVFLMPESLAFTIKMRLRRPRVVRQTLAIFFKDELAMDLLDSILKVDSETRATVEEALNSAFFETEPLAADLNDVVTEYNRRKQTE